METPRNNEADVLETDTRNYSDCLSTEQEQPYGKKIAKHIQLPQFTEDMTIYGINPKAFTKNTSKN